MTRNGILVCATLLFVASGSLAAKDELAINELYGQAVHAYFNGDFESSHKSLSEAIDLGTDDPRVFYFRGLSKMELGREEEAQKDFEQGGKLEASGPAQFYPIGRSLERVQGKNRMTIEKVRRQARIAIRLRQKKIEQARIEAFKRDERLRNAGPAVQLADPSENSKSSEDPFGTAGAPSANPTPTQPAPTQPTPTQPAPKPQDPFGAPAAKPTTPKPAQPMPKADDPFATPKPKSDDPFAAPPKKKTEPSNDDPFGGASGGNDDPFGGTPEKKSNEKKSDDDPFG